MSKTAKRNQAPEVAAVAENANVAIAPTQQNFTAVNEALEAISEAPKPPTQLDLKTRLMVLSDLQQIAEKIDKIQDHIDEVRRMKDAAGVASPESIELRLNGQTYSIRNQSLIESVCDLLDRQLSQKLFELDQQLNFYPSPN